MMIGADNRDSQNYGEGEDWLRIEIGIMKKGAHF